MKIKVSLRQHGMEHKEKKKEQIQKYYTATTTWFGEYGDGVAFGTVFQDRNQSWIVPKSKFQRRLPVNLITSIVHPNSYQNGKDLDIVRHRG